MTEDLNVLKEQGLAKALAYIETAEGFVVEQAPLLVQEVLRYGLFSAVFWTVFWAAAFGGMMWSSVKLYKVTAKSFGDGTPGAIVGTFGGGGCLAGCFAYLFEAVKIIIAPRLYLLERLDSLL